MIVKASAGGGGRGMRIVRNEEELPGAVSRPRRQKPPERLAMAISTWRSTSSIRGTSSFRCWPMSTAT